MRREVYLTLNEERGLYLTDEIHVPCTIVGTCTCMFLTECEGGSSTGQVYTCPYVYMYMYVSYTAQGGKQVR